MSELVKGYTPHRYVALDPGEMTGFVAVSLPYGDLFRAGEMQPFEALTILDEWLRAGHVSAVGIERWSPPGPRQTWQPAAVYTIGAARYLCSRERVPLFELDREARKRVPSTAVKQLGWWHTGGKGHANDAARHMVLLTLQHAPASGLARKCASVLAA